MLSNLYFNFLVDNGSEGVKNIIKHHGNNDQLPNNVTSAYIQIIFKPTIILDIEPN
jgi:hypothetical protein